MDAYYSATCSKVVSQATLYGRLKEDRGSLPDVTHDTEIIVFSKKGESGDHVTTVSCQNGDSIYSTAQINSEAQSSSDRATMHC